MERVFQATGEFIVFPNTLEIMTAVKFPMFCLLTLYNFACICLKYLDVDIIVLGLQTVDFGN